LVSKPNTTVSNAEYKKSDFTYEIGHFKELNLAVHVEGYFSGVRGRFQTLLSHLVPNITDRFDDWLLNYRRGAGSAQQTLCAPSPLPPPINPNAERSIEFWHAVLLQQDAAIGDRSGAGSFRPQGHIQKKLCSKKPSPKRTGPAEEDATNEHKTTNKQKRIEACVVILETQSSKRVHVTDEMRKATKKQKMIDECVIIANTHSSKATNITADMRAKLVRRTSNKRADADKPITKTLRDFFTRS
jgi:hypothetical protein